MSPDPSNTVDHVTRPAPRTAGVVPDGTAPPGETVVKQPGEVERLLPAPADPVVAVPGYEILSELGRGGMGVVYLARQLSLKRPVALKLMLGAGAASAGQVGRFRVEVEAVAALQHPNIVQVYEFGEHGGHPFWSLEYVPGGSLAAALATAPPPTPVAPERSSRRSPAPSSTRTSGASSTAT